MKKTIFSVLLVCFVVIVLELMSALVFIAATGKFPFYSAFLERQQKAAHIVGEEPVGIQATGDDSWSIHPYFGYTLDPANPPWWFDGVDDYGFTNLEEPPIQKRSKDKVLVGVFGGSVSHQTARLGRKEIENALHRVEGWEHKEIVVLRYGIGGFKQPQPLLVMTYLLSLGAEFDVVLLVDGFNEIVLPPVGNTPYKTFPFFPVYWQLRLSSGLDPAVVKIVGRMNVRQETRQSLAGLMAQTPLHYSMTLNTAWFFVDRWLDASIAGLQAEFHARKDKAVSYAQTGPPFEFRDNEELYDKLARHWRDCSLQMRRLAESTGARFFHFLQPNQYLPGSKPLSNEEANDFYDQNSIYKQHVVKGYPYLQHYGLELIREGVNYYDMSDVFKDVEATVYSDDCCHFSMHGAAMLTEAMMEHVSEYYQETGFKGDPVLPRKKADTAFSLDTVNGKPYHLLDSDAPLQRYKKACDGFTLTGWAVDDLADKPASGVDVILDGKVYPAEYGIARTDIAKERNKPEHENCGFLLRLSPMETDTGTHSLFLKIYAANKEYYYRFGPFKFILEK